MKFLKNYLLLVSLITIILASPFLEDLVLGGVISLVLICIAIFLCLLVLSIHPRIFRFMVIFSALIIGFEIIGLIFPSPLISTIQYFNLMVLIFLFAGILFYSLMTSQTLSFSDISNAISVYILIGIGFGFLYSFIERIHPGAISNSASSISDISGDMIYFSFIALTTVGFGDILPVIKATKVLAMFEAVLGVLYIAIMIGRLVGIGPASKKNQ
ncbi:MAG: two pore domain potassium channel family protein [Bacteroidetes bacterium]|nr:MAG: two pore domain potassium channel family protein [Bacteroidota bacterium]